MEQQPSANQEQATPTFGVDDPDVRDTIKTLKVNYTYAYINQNKR
jgi:hypothetical protein